MHRPIRPGRGPYKLAAEYWRVADKIGEERAANAGGPRVTREQEAI